MTEIKEHKVDRTGWESGPWDEEPDRAEWRHAGVPCLAVRNSLGNWCGYAAVSPGHPFYGVDYAGRRARIADSEKSTPESVLEVHGGITYSNFCREGGPICHVAAAGEEEKVYWFGFDCGHPYDLSPGMLAIERKHGWHYGPDDKKHYRDLDYVKRQTNKLAEQLAAMASR